MILRRAPLTLDRTTVARIPASLQEVSLSRWFKYPLFAALLALLAGPSPAQNQSPVALDTSETLFTVLTAINTCGYDQDLAVSDRLRSKVRSEVTRARQVSQAAEEATQAMCQYYQEHQQPDPSKTLAQYVSLALYLTPPPALTAKVKDADMPPDAALVLGILPLLQKFYEAVGLHSIWDGDREAVAALTGRYHEALAKMLFDTEIYLKLPSSSRLGRDFTVFIDPMGASGQTNARNYGSDYYVVISPGPGAGLKMDQIRHTYLHYLLDPLALKYPASMEQLKPLLGSVKGAPMDESFKTDVSLLATECLIRAVEARMIGSSRTPETERSQLVERSVEQGFILTPYFYQALVRFEKSPAGLRIAYGELIGGIDVRKEQKSAAQIKFASKADQELLHLSRPTEAKLLITAEQRLSSGDSEAARKLAQQALDEKREDPGRALFILAQVATMNRDMQGARNYFQQALDVAREPKVVAWSHIYLARIYDDEGLAEQAKTEYQAALAVNGGPEQAKQAAQKGLAAFGAEKPSERP